MRMGKMVMKPSSTLRTVPCRPYRIPSMSHMVVLLHMATLRASVLRFDCQGLLFGNLCWTVFRVTNTSQRDSNNDGLSTDTEGLLMRTLKWGAHNFARPYFCNSTKLKPFTSAIASVEKFAAQTRKMF